MTRRDPNMDRRSLFASAAAATLLVATGVSASGMPQRGGRLRMALSGAARSDTWVSGDGLFMQVARQGLVFDALTQVAADGTLRGELATEWRASSDARVWEFRLREGVTFHDGRNFSAHDVVASLSNILPANLSVTSLDSVQITLRDPDADFPLRLSEPAYVIRPAHDLGSSIGTGLYRLSHFAPGQQILTTRVADHYKGDTAGWFDEVELVSIPSEAVRAEALSAYMVDAVDMTDPHALAGFADFTLQPDRRRILHAISADLRQPAQVGFQRPLDNLRAAERWWFA